MGGADNAANVAGLLTRVASGAGAQAHANQQTPGQESSVLDVWTHSHDGMSDRLSEVAADPSILVTSRFELAGAVATGLASGGAGTTHGEAVDSMAAQMAGLGDGLSAISAADGALATIGATFAFLTSIEQMLSTAFSIIPFPAFPALRITDLDVGLPHAHSHPPNLTPPNPVPVPLPSTGPVIPIPILSGASRTLINGMPAARCGDMGLGVWCGGYFPMYEVFLGSSSVWIEGARAARLAFDITKHCIFTCPKPSDPPVGPMVGFTTLASTNVLIGGVPMPSLLSLALGAAFKALFKGIGKGVSWLRRLRASQLADSAADEVTQVVRRAPPPASANLGPIHRELCAMLHTPGMRHTLRPGWFSVDDLARMTRATRDEWAVVVDRRGALVLVRGRGSSIAINRGDTLLAHSHPSGNVSPSTADLRGIPRHGAVTDSAIVGPDGNVGFFNADGPVDSANAFRPFNEDGVFGA